MDDGCVIQNVYEFNSEGGNFSNEDTAKGVCDGGIKADEGEGGIICLVFVKVDSEILIRSVFETRNIVGSSDIHSEISLWTIHAIHQANVQGSLWRGCW